MGNFDIALYHEGGPEQLKLDVSITALHEIPDLGSLLNNVAV